jgi:hypothetical protein
MLTFFETLKMRSEWLFYFGAIFLIGALACIILIAVTQNQVLGVNAFLKPFKFLLSSAILSWTLAWYIGYLGQRSDITIVVWIIIANLCLQDIYIFMQAARGMMSHFNVSTPFYSGMFSLMAASSTMLTLGVLYIGVQFWRGTFPELPAFYVWAIRLGFLVFVLFAFQGFAMGARMAHTVGAPDGSDGLPIVNWSRRFGDLRIAHFVGMHALQVLPLLAFYVLRNTKTTFAVSALYVLMAGFTLVQAFKGKPLLPDRHHNKISQQDSQL